MVSCIQSAIFGRLAEWIAAAMPDHNAVFRVANDQAR